jgi:hypothetical protein
MVVWILKRNRRRVAGARPGFLMTVSSSDPVVFWGGEPPTMNSRYDGSSGGLHEATRSPFVSLIEDILMLGGTLSDRSRPLLANLSPLSPPLGDEEDQPWTSFARDEDEDDFKNDEEEDDDDEDDDEEDEDFDDDLDDELEDDLDDELDDEFDDDLDDDDFDDLDDDDFDDDDDDDDDDDEDDEDGGEGDAV